MQKIIENNCNLKPKLTEVFSIVYQVKQINTHQHYNNDKTSSPCHRRRPYAG